MAVTVLHLTRLEFYRMNPGIFFDMVQIFNDNQPKLKNKNDLDYLD